MQQNYLLNTEQSIVYSDFNKQKRSSEYSLNLVLKRDNSVMTL